VTNKHKEVIILLGVSPIKCSHKNPLDYSHRVAMIREKFPNVTFCYISDTSCDIVWSNNLDETIRGEGGFGSTGVKYAK
jgi:nicotinamide mononucleotide adenylyltransferase